MGLMKKSKSLKLLVKWQFIGQRFNETGHEHHVHGFSTIGMELKNEQSISDFISIGRKAAKQTADLDLGVTSNYS